MNTAFSIFKIHFKRLFQYRLAAFAGIATQVFWGIIKVMILEAFYLHSSASQPLSLEEAIVFIWLGQALLQLLPWSIDKGIEEEIRQGHVSYYLIRPIPLYQLWFFRALALRFVPTLLRCLPVFLFACFFYALPLLSFSHFLAFLLSLTLGLLLASAITTLVMISLFWTLSGTGIQRLLPHITLLLSGLVVPLPLFPDSIKWFLDVQPFRCLIDIPSRIYVGLIREEEWVAYLALQLVWLMIIVFSGHYLMKKATRRLVIQGG